MRSVQSLFEETLTFDNEHGAFVSLSENSSIAHRVVPVSVSPQLQRNDHTVGQLHDKMPLVAANRQQLLHCAIVIHRTYRLQISSSVCLRSLRDATRQVNLVLA